MPILSDHRDLVEAVAADNAVPLSLLEAMLCREEEFELAQALGEEANFRCPLDVSATCAADGLPRTPLRLIRADAENLPLLGSVATLDPTEVRNAMEDAFGPSAWSWPKMLRLLFLGTQDVDVRTVGFPPATLDRHSFVRGLEDAWPGLLQPDATYGNESSAARIRAECDLDGTPITIERSWTVAGADWSEEISILEDGTRLTGRAAVARLCRILPPAHVPLFFFGKADVLGLLVSPTFRRRTLDRLYPAAFLAALRMIAWSSSAEATTPVASQLRHAPPRTEAVLARRKRDQAMRMRHAARGRMHALLARLREAEAALVCLTETTSVHPRRDFRRWQRGWSAVSVPEPLQPGDVTVSDRHSATGMRRATGEGGRDEHLARRQANLQAEIDLLRRRSDTELAESKEWGAVLDARNWELRTYAAEDAVAAMVGTTPKEPTEASRVCLCLDALNDGLRKRSRAAVHAALKNHVCLMDPSGSSTFSLVLDDMDELDVIPNGQHRLGIGPTPMMEERMALILLRAMQEASGSQSSVVTALSGTASDHVRVGWIEAGHASSLPPGAVLPPQRIATIRRDAEMPSADGLTLTGTHRT